MQRDAYVNDRKALGYRGYEYTLWTEISRTRLLYVSVALVMWVAVIARTTRGGGGGGVTHRYPTSR